MNRRARARLAGFGGGDDQTALGGKSRSSASDRRAPTGLLRALAELARRKESNLSRTLKKLHEAGIVDFEDGAGRTRAPRLVARRVTLDLDLVGPASFVSVERPEVR